MSEEQKREKIKKKKTMTSTYDRRMIGYIEDAKTCTDVNNYFQTKQDETDSSLVNKALKFFFKHHPQLAKT